MQKNESKILQLPHSFLAFIDEVGDPFVHFDVKTYNNPSIFPVVTILALVVSRKMYTEILMPGLEEIKKYFLGLQVADYCTYPFARHAKSPSDSNNEFFHFLRKFVYKGDYWEYGLKEWP